MAPSTADDKGIEVKRLPGLTKGEAFLRKRHPDAFARWVGKKATKVETVSRMLRHTSVVTTQKFYDRMEATDAWTYGGPAEG